MNSESCLLTVRFRTPRSVSGVLLLIAISMVCVRSAAADPNGRYLSDYLISRDLVVRGTLLSLTPVTHRPAGGCGLYGFSTLPGLLLVIQPDSVLFGSLADSALTIFMWGHHDFEPGTAVPGSRVLAY